VDSITALLANVCVFLLKCRTILNGECPDAYPALHPAAPAPAAPLPLPLPLPLPMPCPTPPVSALLLFHFPLEAVSVCLCLPPGPRASNMAAWRLRRSRAAGGVGPSSAPSSPSVLAGLAILHAFPARGTAVPRPGGARSGPLSRSSRAGPPLVGHRPRGPSAMGRPGHRRNQGYSLATGPWSGTCPGAPVPGPGLHRGCPAWPLQWAQRRWGLWGGVGRGRWGLLAGAGGATLGTPPPRSASTVAREGGQREEESEAQ